MIDIVALSGRKKDKLIQFAIDVGKVKTEKLKFPMLLSTKLDGCYVLALKHGSAVTLYSRTGEVYVSMKHIELELSKIMLEDDIIIFEAYCRDIVQSTISGWCRDTKAQHTKLSACCHTFLSLDEFIHGGKVPYASNDLLLATMITNGNIDRIVIYYVPQVMVYSMEEAMSYTQKVWDDGGEGCVLRDPSAVFQGGKRNASIIKLKQSVTYDLEVVGMEIGKGKYANTLGVLVVRWSNGKTLSISGMSDAQRREWWDNPSTIIGKIVEVMGMRDSSKGLLRECRFRSIRFDKCTADY